MNMGTYEWLEEVALKMGENSLKELQEKMESDKEDNGRMNAYSQENHHLLSVPFLEVQTRLTEIFAKGYLQGKNVEPDENKEYIIETILSHYDFFEHQLGEFFEKYEPRGCDYDKASFILNAYLHFTATGELLSFTKGEEEFWKPKLGTAEQWMSFVTTLLQLHNGKPTAYFKAYSEIVDLYLVGVPEEKERLHHILIQSPYYVRHDEEEDEIVYHFVSGEETAKVTVNVIGDSRVSYYTPGMKGVKLTEKIKRKLKFPSPQWVKELSASI